MREIRGHDAALAVLNDPRFVVPPVPFAETGVGWLRATVGRFATGDDHDRRRALSEAIIRTIPPATASKGHPVEVLARAMGIEPPVVDLVRDVAQAYQPGSGDDTRADAAVERLIAILGGERSESTAARIGVLVQACDATVALRERVRDRPLDDVLRDDPPVRATKRQATVPVTVGGLDVGAGEVVLVELRGDLAFGAGPRRCPGRALALALVSGDSGGR
jgi:cytochrome P450